MSVYALILAGGSGTRFWPLSRDVRPKQLLALFDEETLIEKTVNRLNGLVPPERILVLTSQTQVEAIRKTLPGVPADNIVAEPARRDTAPAIALAAGWIAARDPDAVMVALPADQLITDEAGFQKVLSIAADYASRSEAVVTLGISPDWPCPSYGYIERGTLIEETDGQAIYSVASFKEKPSPEIAETYLAAGNFTWNAGIFVWSLATLRRELSEHCGALDEFIGKLAEAPDFEAYVAEHFPHLEKVSIDYALMENATEVTTIDASVGWDDVGGWPSVAKYLEIDESGNSSRGPVLALDSRDNIIFSDGDQPIVALLGVNNLIIVQTKDATLVANRECADEIKQLVDALPDQLR
ncbi:MAG: sugar phosphate nucleotidyltransferase [Verrucomicrobiota bacterium]